MEDEEHQEDKEIQGIEVDIRRSDVSGSLLLYLHLKRWRFVI